MVIDQIDLIIKQPQIMSCQEKLSADSWKNYKRNFSDSMVAASTDNQLYSKSTPALYMTPVSGVGHNHVCL